MNRPAMPAAPPPRAMPRPPGMPAPTNGNTPSSEGRPIPSGHGLTVKDGLDIEGEKLFIFGVGGVGKSTLCSLIAEMGIRPLFVDAGNSTSHLSVARVKPTTHDQVRAALHDDALLAPYGAVVLDDMTACEEFGRSWVLANITHEKGYKVDSIEGYGWGKGYVHLFEASHLLLADLDRIARMGKHVLVTAHDEVAEVKNVFGDNYLQHQPRLQSNKNARFRERMREWSYHTLFMDFDVAVTEDGKGVGSGSRTIYPNPLPTHWAKSRTLREPIPFVENDPKLWQLLLKKDT